MSTDISQALRDTENALRDFIAYVLLEKLGSGWEGKSGVSPERLAKRAERKKIEGNRQDAGAVDERLIYYADYYDLQTILKKHWQYFAVALGDLKTTEVWLTELEKTRDPDAHRRELLPHQKHLILGISGEIRTKIARFRSTQETSDAYFPRIEFAADNMGRRMVLALLPVLILAMGSVRAQQPVAAEGVVQGVLRSNQKWLFAHTSRLPLDPLEIWNRWPATVDIDGDRVRLNVMQPYRDMPSVFALQVQAAGFTFDWPGHAEFFMRLDATDANAPFKGRTRDMTIWLLRTQ